MERTRELCGDVISFLLAQSYVQGLLLKLMSKIVAALSHWLIAHSS